ncbi:MAG: MarR family winged helix-turn-helix transcriptional regulator [Myxococcales bacterium]
MGAHASADAKAVLDAIRRIVRLLRQSDRDAEKRTGLSGAQLFVLQQLRSGGGGLTPGELSRRTLTHQSSVSGVVRRLSEAGFVRRVRSSADARRIELWLTPAGRAAVRRAPKLAQQRLISAVDLLQARQRSALARGLASLIRQLGIGVLPPPMFFEEGAPVAE